ncbi:carboxypeptidase-like regulatory domain-containing protein [Actinomadura gamaensis]|uniref:Carboxypeptidase-like regulatory domain-containing protein n=1 Tax=Actinomadura gamaensis TaxID=1763541 RepID=A0ABV9TYD2_9ACTN
MRKPLAALLSLLIAVSLLPATPASADDAGDGPALTGVTVRRGTDSPRAALTVMASSNVGVAKVTARLRTKGESAPYASFDDLTQDTGTENSGSWRSTPVELRPGRTLVDVELTDSAGGRAVLPAAAFVDLPYKRFDVWASGPRGAGYSVDVAGAFGVRGKVQHTDAVSRVTAQLYKWRTNEKVGGEVGLTLHDTATIGDYDSTEYRTADDAFAPPLGEYDAVVTAWDAQGDTVSSRTQRIHVGLANSLTDLKVTPDRYDADHLQQPAVITGRLVDADGRPLAGRTISADGTDAKVTTAQDGTFSIDTIADAAAHGGRIGVTAAASGDYLKASGTVTLTRQVIATRISAAASTTDARIGDKVTVSGTLERQTATGWSPLAGEKVSLIFHGMENACEEPWAYPVTDAQGRYSLSTTVGCHGDWQIDFNNPVTDAAFAPSENRVRVKANYATAVTDVKATPSPAAFGSKFAITGRVVRLHASAAHPQVNGGEVQLWSSRDGKNWNAVSKGKTAGDGRFTFNVTASADAYWRVAYDGTSLDRPAYNLDLASTGKPVYVDVRYRTAITSLNASPEPVRKGRTITVKGRITKYTGTWQPGSGAAVVISFLPRGAKTWKAVATVKAGRDGWFSKGFKASADGTWSASYAGSAAYLGSKSAGDYVDVR